MTGEDDARSIGALLRDGREAEARAAAQAALAAGRDHDAVLAFAGMLAARAGDAAAAVEPLRTLLGRRPDDRSTRLNLAQALAMLERWMEVAALLEGHPSEPAIDRLRAYAALRQGDASGARVAYRRVLSAWRDDADSWANLGAAEASLGAFNAAIAALEEAITLRRAEPRFYLALADILERADRPVERRRVVRDAAAIAPDDSSVQLALGLAEAAAEHMAAAEAAMRRASTLAPADPAAWLELGLLFETQNRIADLDRLIADATPHVGAELNLLRAWSSFRAGDLEVADGFARAMPDTVSRLRRAQLRAQIADRRGDIAAFALFTEMNAAALEISPAASGPDYRTIVERGTAALRAATIVPVARVEDAMADPVFVVGFPRSGTTLIDTLLGRLPDTHVLEEQPILPTIEREIGGVDAILAQDTDAIASLRARYRALLARLAPEATGRGRIVDKHPLHMARMPLIDRLFPGAPVLLVERHPYDVVLSCFMANFRLNQAMRSFTDLMEAALTYDAVFTAWREAETRLTLNVHRIRYERLVDSLEDEMRAAVAHIGGTFRPEVLDNVAAARERGRVRTASYSQVTEPIYRRAVARWRRYRNELEPVMPILAPWAMWMGYEED